VTQITDHLADIRARVADALKSADRSGDPVVVVAVSKRQAVEDIRAAFDEGQTQFGESYVQEALAKIAELQNLPIEWHFIGPIQANKTRAIAEHFQWVHSIDRLRVAERLNAQRPFHAPPLNVLIQVNLSGEPRKSGIPKTGVAELAKSIATLPRLRLRGLMGIPPAGSSVAESAAFYAGLRQARCDLRIGGVETDTLSMGMSADFEVALQNGSTCVRIGTALFGDRAS
jgi:pyridoxal phosphate enzyme (YggS family)